MFAQTRGAVPYDEHESSAHAELPEIAWGRIMFARNCSMASGQLMRHYQLALVALAVLSGCAAQPHPAAPIAPSAAAPPPASASASAATGTAATEFKPPGGWLTRVKDGKTLYCRTDSTVTSRIPKYYCLTQADLKELLARQKGGVEEIERMRSRAPGMCAAGQSCN